MTGFSSTPITTTFGSGIWPLPENEIVEGDNTLPSPFFILAVLSPLPFLWPLPFPIGFPVIGSVVISLSIIPVCSIQGRLISFVG